MIERLKFGNAEHIALCEKAPDSVRAYRTLASAAKPVDRRHWRKPGAQCADCVLPIQQGDLLVHIGKRVFHERCLTAFILKVRRDLRMLGYDPAVMS